MPEILSDVLLGSNKLATAGWAATAGRTYDIVLGDYGPGRWSLACNWRRIGKGSIGWIIRADQGWGHVAGSLAVEKDPREEKEEHGDVWYAPGIIFPWPCDWWIDGARLHLAGWVGSPFAMSKSGQRTSRFQGGQMIAAESLALIQDFAHPVALEWADRHRE